MDSMLPLHKCCTMFYWEHFWCVSARVYLVEEKNLPKEDMKELESTVSYMQTVASSMRFDVWG